MGRKKKQAYGTKRQSQTTYTTGGYTGGVTGGQTSYSSSSTSYGGGVIGGQTSYSSSTTYGGTTGGITGGITGGMSEHTYVQQSYTRSSNNLICNALNFNIQLRVITFIY